MSTTSFSRPYRVAMLILAVGGSSGPAWSAPTPLFDQPVIVADVPPNVVLALSVEFPTAITRAHQGYDYDYYGGTEYLGYFDPRKCYVYKDSVFVPSGASTGQYFACSGQWSGNFMNWATMQGIDTFRWVMTGGNRIVDTPQSFDGASGSPAGRTVLQRAYASPQGSYLTENFPDRGIGPGAVPLYTGLGSAFLGKSIVIRNGGMGFGVRFCTGEASPTCVEMNVSVEVCRDDDQGRPLESFCQAYQEPLGKRTVYKPVGLIQRYKDKMNFGAFGYLALANVSAEASPYVLDGPGGTYNLYKDGGVLRSPVQSVSNEISETGAFKLDPYGLKDDKKGIDDSGTINYLNKFGSKSHIYKHYDPVSEMYAEVIKYLRHKSPTASYLPPADAYPEVYDGFPAFTRWDDPAVDARYPGKGPLACKRNYVIGIGDTNTNFDFELSGTGAQGTPSPHNHATPSDVDGDMAGKTAKEWTDAIGVFEGLGGLGAQVVFNGSYLMAGIAYFAHSSDIRQDIPGVQTVSTYWMDVLERGYRERNQFWLAAKYGGYAKPPDTAKLFEPGKDAWKDPVRSYYGYELPSNYYTASDPATMRQGLAAAFQSISAGAGAGAGAALSSVQVSTNSGGANTYQSSYNAGMWSGDLVASRIDRVTVDEPVLTRLWSAAERLNAMGSNARKIITLAPHNKNQRNPAPGDLVGAAFRWSDLSTVQQLNLSRGVAQPEGNAVDGEAILNYLRGDRSNETTATTQSRYRQRNGVLGDIVDSSPRYLGKPAANYSDAYNPGYSTFVSDQADRTPLVLVGANDGMLHAFDASEGANAGNELFALIPYSLFEGPDGNPEISGIQALARKTYAHRYYMNATAEVRDVDFARTGGKLDSFPADKHANWRSLMVVGQGKGGRSFVAMDVTNITASASETELARKVLWEFTHPDMGFSFGLPLIAKTRRWGWVVIVTGGYNNTRGDNPGQGALFVINAKTGELLTERPLYTGAGSAKSPSGFAQMEGYTPSYQDYTLDYVYGGDLDGNLWRFDFTNGDIDSPPVVKLAEFVIGGSRQPITVAPKIEYSVEDLKRYVFVGTGRLLGPDDQLNSQQHSFYAVQDGTQSRAYGSERHQLPLPEGASLPVTRAMLSPVTDPLAGAVIDSSKPMGWYTDLTGNFVSSDPKADPVTERVVLNLQANEGVVSWVGSILNDDPCNASGTSRIYAVRYGSGQSVLQTLVNGATTPIPWIEVANAGLAGTALVRVNGPAGSSIRIMGTDTKGGIKMYDIGGPKAGNPRVVNWRVIRDQ